MIRIEGDLSEVDRYRAILGAYPTIARRGLDRLMRTIDRDITEHVRFQWTGEDWAPHAKSTLETRKQADKGGALHTYYGMHKRAVKGNAFGWTGEAQEASTAPGEITLSGSGAELVRDFAEGDHAGDRIRWFHFGSSNRPKRPIYKDEKIDSIYASRVDQFEKALATALGGR